MAWASDDWRQNDDEFYGYPVPINASVPETIDKSKLPISWVVNSSFYGYPIFKNASIPEIIDKSVLPSVWKFDNAFYGYPHVTHLDLPNPYNIYIGSMSVYEIYMGTDLIWKANGTNKINLPELS